MPVSSKKIVNHILTDVSGVLKPSRYDEKRETVICRFPQTPSACLLIDRPLTRPVQNDAAPGSTTLRKVNSFAGSRRKAAQEPQGKSQCILKTSSCSLSSSIDCQAGGWEDHLLRPGAEGVCTPEDQCIHKPEGHSSRRDDRERDLGLLRAMSGRRLRQPDAAGGLEEGEGGRNRSRPRNRRVRQGYNVGGTRSNSTDDLYS